MSRESIQRLLRIAIIVIYLVVIICFNNFIISKVPVNEVSAGHIDNKTAISILLWIFSWIVIPLVIWGIAALIRFIWCGEGNILEEIEQVYDELENWIFKLIGKEE